MEKEKWISGTVQITPTKRGEYAQELMQLIQRLSDTKRKWKALSLTMQSKAFGVILRRYIICKETGVGFDISIAVEILTDALSGRIVDTNNMEVKK